MKILTDQNVPEPVGDVFLSRGHMVVRLREVLEIDAPDHKVADYVNLTRSLLITWDADFAGMSGVLSKRTHRGYRYAGRILFLCKGPLGERRTEELIDLIEYEYEKHQQKADKRLFMEIGAAHYKVER